MTTRRLAEIVLVEDGRETLLGTVVSTGPPDLALVDALLRVRLWANRSGRTVVLRAVDGDLAALFALVGLAAFSDPGVLRCRRQAEGGEEVGVEEEVHTDDPVA